MQHRHTQRQIESKLDRLRRSERKVADYVLAVGVSKMKGPEVNSHLGKLNRGLQSLRTEQ